MHENQSTPTTLEEAIFKLDKMSARTQTLEKRLELLEHDPGYIQWISGLEGVSREDLLVIGVRAARRADRYSRLLLVAQEELRKALAGETTQAYLAWQLDFEEKRALKARIAELELEIKINKPEVAEKIIDKLKDEVEQWKAVASGAPVS